jgi:hypothetical protein
VLDKQEGRGQYTPITPSYAPQRQQLKAWINTSVDTEAFVSILLKKVCLKICGHLFAFQQTQAYQLLSWGGFIYVDIVYLAN